jgi:hypothetical protein
MKTGRLELKCTIAIFLLVMNICSSQTLGISPNSEANAVCPRGDITYTISNYNTACHTISVINGTVVQNNDDGTLIVNWFDNGLKGSITVTRNNDGCSGIAGTRTFDVPIKTLAQVRPTITGPLAPNGPRAGFVNPVTYTAQLNWPFRGTNDPDPFPVTEFNWTLPPGWSNNTFPATSPTITVVTNIGGGGQITATGRTNCGAGATNSLTANNAVNRTLTPPCPIVAQRLNERCGEPGVNAFAASSQPEGYGSNNPQWSWSLPQGWTFNGPTNSQFINVNTDGQNGGTVTATFSDYGVSASCPIAIPLVVATPGTFVNGNDRLCEIQPYSLSSPVAAGASVTWSVTPQTAPVVPTAGQGTTATLTPISGSGAGSQATLTFNISGCGVNTAASKSFFAGRPLINDHWINGEYTHTKYVCPGYHLLSAQILGDDTNPPCMTWELINNQGAPPHSLHSVNCNWASVYVNPQNTAPAFVKVTAENECGATVSYFYLYRTWAGCKEQYSFTVYPNPASSVLNLEVQFDDGQDGLVPVPIKHAQLVNMHGVTALDMPNLDNQEVQMGLASVPNGLYVVRAKVGDEWFTETVQVSK